MTVDKLDVFDVFKFDEGNLDDFGLNDVSDFINRRKRITEDTAPENPFRVELVFFVTIFFSKYDTKILHACYCDICIPKNSQKFVNAK